MPTLVGPSESATTDVFDPAQLLTTRELRQKGDFMPNSDGPDIEPPTRPRTHSKTMVTPNAHGDLATIDGPRPTQPPMTGVKDEKGSMPELNSPKVLPFVGPKTHSRKNVHTSQVQPPLPQTQRRSDESQQLGQDLFLRSRTRQGKKAAEH